jgi:sulfhydrogenase subunit alpha
MGPSRLNSRNAADMTHKNDRVLSVRELARVEGEGALYMRASGNRVEEARLDIYEPPRFFEAFLRGRAFTEPPDITARICGICPVAYQMSACQALEAACGVTVGEPIADLRRLLYCGEWIESHALHIYLLHAPDFLGYRSGIEMATERRDIVERGLALKKAGNAIMEVVGGRPIHPVNVRLGGFYRAPARAELAALTDPLRRALDDALATVARGCRPTSRSRATRRGTRHHRWRTHPADRGLDRVGASRGRRRGPGRAVTAGSALPFRA